MSRTNLSRVDHNRLLIEKINCLKIADTLLKDSS
jgi:hypothetical protein